MKKQLKILFTLFIPLNLYCQMTPVTSQYVLNPLTINAAYSGTRGAMNLAAFYRKQWVGVYGSPETMTFAADAPVLDNKLGLGFIITNDKIGVTKDTKINTSYAYKIDAGEGILSLGLGAGLITTNTAWSELVVVDQGDEIYLADSKVFLVPAFSFGPIIHSKIILQASQSRHCSIINSTITRTSIQWILIRSIIIIC